MPNQSRYAVKDALAFGGEPKFYVESYREALFWARLVSYDGLELYTVIGCDRCDHVI